jgi:hypothetical protein
MAFTSCQTANYVTGLFLRLFYILRAIGQEGQEGSLQ